MASICLDAIGYPKGFVVLATSGLYPKALHEWFVMRHNKKNHNDSELLRPQGVLEKYGAGFLCSNVYLLYL